MIIVHFRVKKGTFYSHNGVIMVKKCDEFGVEKAHNRIKMGNLNRL